MGFTLLVWACPVDISRHVMDHLSHRVGSEEALNLVMPFLEKIAEWVDPASRRWGPRGSGHYVKMVHNGIEQGMLSTLCEVWGFMTQSMDMEYGDIASVFDLWNRKGRWDAISWSPSVPTFVALGTQKIIHTYWPMSGTRLCRMSTRLKGPALGLVKKIYGYISLLRRSHLHISSGLPLLMLLAVRRSRRV